MDVSVLAMMFIQHKSGILDLMKYFKMFQNYHQKSYPIGILMILYLNLQEIWCLHIKTIDLNLTVLINQL